MNVPETSAQKSVSARREDEAQHLGSGTVSDGNCLSNRTPAPDPTSNGFASGSVLRRDRSRPPAWLRFGIAIACVFVGWLATDALKPELGLTPLPIASWYGGLGPGVLAMVLSALAGDWFFIPPIHSWSFSGFSDFAHIGAFLFSSAFIIVAMEVMRRARERLRESEERLRLSLRAGRLGCFVWDIAINHVTADATHRAMWGLNPDADLTPEFIFKLIHRDDVERVKREEQAGFHAGHQESEFRIVRPNGEIRWLAVNTDVIYGADGNAVKVAGLNWDITERKRAEEAVRAKRAELALMLRSTPFMLTRCSRDLRYQYVSRAYAEMVGLPPEEIAGKPIASIMGKGFETIRPYVERVLRGEQVEYEAPVEFPNIGVRDLSVSYVPERNGDGRVVGWIASVIDATERNTTAEALRLSERRARAFLENSAIVAWLKDEQGRNVFLSDNYVRRFMLRDWENRTDFELWPKEVAEAFRKNDLIVLGKDRPLECIEKAQAPNGEVSWWLNSKFWFQNGAGRKYVGGVGVDITERKRAEEALRASEERLRQAIQVARLGSFEHDHRLDKIEFSEAMREMHRLGADEDVTIPAIMERVVPEDREKLGAAIRRAHDPAGEGVFEMEYRVASEGQRVRWISARARTFFEGEGIERRPVRTIGAALDITEQKEFQAELQRLVNERTAKLQELVGELEHFSYTITHDMRAPLRAMRAFAEMLNQASDRLGEEERAFVGRIIAGAERMDALIADALSYSKAVRTELPLGPVDAGKLLRGILDTYPQFQGAQAEITVDRNLPRVMANEAGLTQCFSNLLDNAVKFVRPGQRAKVHVGSEVRDGWVRLWVEDEGIGISKEMLPRVFDMFAHGSSAQAGTGIGLALVRKVVDRMGGKVGVESEPGRGTRVWVEFKAGDVNSAAAEIVRVGSAAS